MKLHTVSLIVRCYPTWFREQYGDEYRALLEELPAAPRTVLDAFKGALLARLADLRTRTARSTNSTLAAQMASHAAGLCGSFALLLTGCAVVYGLLDDSSVAVLFHDGNPLRLVWLLFVLMVGAAGAQGAAGLFIVRRLRRAIRSASPSASATLRRRVAGAAVSAGLFCLCFGAAMAGARQGVHISTLGAHLILGTVQTTALATVVAAVRAVREWLMDSRVVRTIAAAYANRARSSAMLTTCATWAGRAAAFAAFAGTGVALLTSSPIHLGPLTVGSGFARGLAVVLLAVAGSSAILRTNYIARLGRMVGRRTR